MKFKLERIGLIESAEIELAELTIICGENNTGKTYATYAIYGFLQLWKRLLQNIISSEIKKKIDEEEKYVFDLHTMFAGKINNYLERLGKEYSKRLHRVFASKADSFQNANFIPYVDIEKEIDRSEYRGYIQYSEEQSIMISKESGKSILEVLISGETLKPPSSSLSYVIAKAIINIIFTAYIPPAHIASAERTGVAIFRKELDMARTRILKAISQIDSKEWKQNPEKLLDFADIDYALPVEEDVDFIRRLEDINNKRGWLASNRPSILKTFESIVGGTYEVSEDKVLYFKTKREKLNLKMNESSSSVRALMYIGFYLRCKAKIGDLFIIDEPELNLHPKNQRAIARLVVRLINAGIKIFITTHSDYFIKEFNTAIMLNQKTQHTKKIQQDYKYDDDELLDPNLVKLYMTKKLRKGGANTLKPAKITSDEGIEVATFDDTINIMNKIQEQILFGD